MNNIPLTNTYKNNTFTTPNINQLIATKLNQNTRFRSLKFDTKPNNNLSYNNPNNTNPPKTSPHTLFKQIFNNSFQLPNKNPIINPTLTLQHSVLDTIIKHIKSLQNQLNTSNKLHLEQHLKNIQKLKKHLTKLKKNPPNLTNCTITPKPKKKYPNIKKHPQLSTKNQTFYNITTLTLTYNQTHVFNNFFTYPINNNLFPLTPTKHHQLTHNKTKNQPKIHKITLQYIEKLTYQIESLMNIQENNNTLLNHIIILGTTKISLNKTHSLKKFPIILANNYNNKLKTNIHYHSINTENTNKVILNIIQTTNMDTTSFGTKNNKTTNNLSTIKKQ